MSGHWRAVATRALLVGAGVATARFALRAGRSASSVSRTNYRGNPVSLAGGPAIAIAGAVTAAVGAATSGRGSRTAAAALVAGLGAGVVGRYDDRVGGQARQQAKGFQGHLSALRQGRLTSGTVKIVGVGAAGLVAAALLEPTGRPWWRAAGNVALGAGTIAGAANLLNLLDLRPGRALKVGILLGAPLAVGPSGGLVAGPLGASLGLLPADLREQSMLGDSGANALGALLGVALAARSNARGRAAALASIVVLTAASERVSFTEVIARTPVLRELDELGRRGA